MTTDEYGFHFEKQGLSGEEGPIDPAQQYFEGSHADHAIVRETGQNTLDNPGQQVSGPIRMEFELATMAVADIPGIDRLRKHIEAAAAQTENQQGHSRMVKAATLAGGETIPVLRISDYNTTGLTGSESLDSNGSPLSRLTRGTGGSLDDERGGSFGIGSAVGPMASDLCTVIYTSIPEDTGKSVMAGYTRLATHTVNGICYRAAGHFTRLTTKTDFDYLRPAPRLKPFPKRTEPGTDILVLGYRMADRDPELERVRDAMIDNFMAAIFHGKLVVEGRAPGNHWTLNADSLPGFAKRRPDAHAFYQALNDPDPAKTIISEIGRVRLYINIDDRLERKLHTITMRKPLMKIDTFRHNSISAKYAAVLVCDSPEGNKYLRQLEPPQHHEWDPARERLRGKKVIDSLKTFTRESLKERVSTEIGDEVKIEGLARFLPTEISSEMTSGDPAAPSSESEAGAAAEESSSVTGGGDQTKPLVDPQTKKVRVKVRQPAIAGGDSEIEQGKERGGSRQRRGDEVGLPGMGKEGSGTSRIPRDNLSFRSWMAASNQEGHAVTALAVTANDDETGDIELVGLGPAGEPEESYVLPIARAVFHETGTEIKCAGNTLKDLTLKAKQLTRIDVYMPAGERYRLGVV